MVMEKIVLDSCELLNYATADNYRTEKERKKKEEEEVDGVKRTERYCLYARAHKT